MFICYATLHYCNAKYLVVQKRTSNLCHNGIVLADTDCVFAVKL